MNVEAKITSSGGGVLSVARCRGELGRKHVKIKSGIAKAQRLTIGSACLPTKKHRNLDTFIGFH